MPELNTRRLPALVAVLLVATFGVSFAIARATRSSKPAESVVVPLNVSRAVPAVPTVSSVATLPALKSRPRPSGSTTGSVTPGSTTGSTTGTPSGTATGGASPPSSTTGGGGGATTGGGGGTTTE